MLAFFWLLFRFPRALHDELPRSPPPTFLIATPPCRPRHQSIGQRSPARNESRNGRRAFAEKAQWAGASDVAMPTRDLCEYLSWTKRVPGGLGSEERGVLYSKRAPIGEM